MTLLKFGVAELGLDPNKEEERGKFITPTLAKLFKDNGVKIPVAQRELRMLDAPASRLKPPQKAGVEQDDD